MKRLVLLLGVAFSLVAGPSVAYGYQRDQLTDGTPQRVKEEVKRLADTKGASLGKEIEKYQRKIQKELNEYKKRLKHLQAKGENMSDQVKREVKKEISELEKKMDMVEQKLKSMKSEIDTAMNSVRDGYQKIADRFK